MLQISKQSNTVKTRILEFFGICDLDFGFSAKRRGFTLIETLVAVTVLLTAVAAPLTLGSQGLTASRIARDQVVGTYLIQEAIEYTRNVRDTNRLNGASWLSGLSDCIDTACDIDVAADVVTACPEKGCTTLSYNSTTGLYGYSEAKKWEPTKFIRTVTIEQTIPDVEAKITVSVLWQDGLIPRTISAEEYLFNWQ